MIDYTKLQRQLKNVILAQEMWATIPKENVNLNNWQQSVAVSEPTCGTIACFGGWCALYPAFKAQGVFAALCGGIPVFKDGNRTLVGIEVAQELFGDMNLFSSRSSTVTGDDHSEVTRRLSVQRKVLEQELLN